MNISSISSKAMIPTRTRGLTGPTVRLDLGDVVRARIVGDLPGDKVAVRFRGHNLVAESGLNLPKGMEVLSSVTQLEPRIVLRVLGPAKGLGELVGMLRGLGVPMTGENFEAAAGLRAYGAPLTKGYVLGIAEMSAHVSSLVGVPVRPDRIVQLLAFLQGRSDLQTLGAAVSLFFGRTLTEAGLEDLAGLLRALRLGSPFEGPHLMFQIPPWREPEVRGELRVYRDETRRRSSGEASEDRVVLFLDTRRFGPMRVEISLRGREVRCEFQLANRRTSIRFEEKLRDLDEGLSDLGYLVTYLACTIWGAFDRLALREARDSDWFV